MKNDIKYFLAANSCEGFISHFGDCYNPHDNWKAYIIKGGPGTGKSSFMKRVAKSAEERAEKYILCPCSSDPQSLDAVILPDKKTVILDGTAPHTLDPKYPAVCEEILNFGQFWDCGKIGKSDEIITVTDHNKALHKTVAKYLNAAGQIMLDSYKTALSCTKTAQVKAFAQKLCKKYIPRKSGKPYEWARFISGITPNGIVSYPKTIIDSCKNLIIISDKFHSASNVIINEVRNYCLINGYEIITLKNSFLPTLLTDHIIIPELSLAFVTETKDIQFECDTRRIHARRFIGNKTLHNSKERLKLNQKITNSLLDSAVTTLAKAKEIHDKLEGYYINAMDFEALDKFTEKFCKKVFA